MRLRKWGSFNKIKLYSIISKKMNKKFWAKKNILITGASGFIGSNLCQYFDSQGISVFGANQKKIDVLNRRQLEKVCENKKINLIIHCAALDGNTEFKKNNSANIIDQNIRMALNVLEVARQQEIKDIVIMSSSKVYTNIPNGNDNQKLFPINSAYAAAKIITELLADTYAQNFKLNILLPRPSNIYGPGDLKTNKSGRVIQSMIKKALAGEDIEIWGDGKQKKQFIYIDDFIKIFVKMIEIGKFTHLNIANPRAISLTELANNIIKLVNKNIKISYQKNKMPINEKLTINTEEMKTLLDFKLTPLKIGLQKNINFYQKNVRP